MTSGVYKLTFKSGDTYIGKSINIEERWKQHSKAMTEGTAAKPVQDAANKFGNPSGEVLMTCHPDHIDLVEAFFISTLKPSLNTSKPENPFAGLSERRLGSIFRQLDISTLEHTLLLADMKPRIATLSEQLLVAEAKRTKEELNTSSGRKLKQVRKELSEATDAKNDLTSRIEKYNSAGFWHRLFNKV